MTDGFKKIRKAARRERWLRPAKRPTVKKFLGRERLAKPPGFVKKLKKRAKAVKNLLMESRNYNWDKYENLLEKTYKSTRRMSNSTGLPFSLVAVTRSFDFLEPTNPMFPIESRTVTKEKFKEYGMPTTLGYMDAPLLLNHMVNARFAENMGWMKGQGEKVT